MSKEASVEAGICEFLPGVKLTDLYGQIAPKRARAFREMHCKEGTLCCMLQVSKPVPAAESLK